MKSYREAIHHIRTFPTAFWVVIAATLINQLGNMAFVYLMIYANKHLGFSLIHTSLVFAAFSISMFFAGLFGGGLIDKIGAARIMFVVLIGNSFTLLTIPYFHQFYSVAFLCIVWGFFYGLYRPASQTIVSLLSVPGMQKITFSVYRLVLNLGMSIGPVVGGYLAAYSFTWIFISNGIANLLAASILFLGLRHSKWFVKNTNTNVKMKFNLKLLKQDYFLSFFILAFIPTAMIFFQHETTLPIFITDLHFPLSYFGWLLTINTLLIVFCELPLNIATMQWPYRTNFMLGSGFITLGFAGMYFVSQAWHLAVLAVCWTIGEMILFPASNSYIAEISPVEIRGSYMALYNTSYNVGLLLGPLGGALVMQHLGASGLWIACGLWGMLSVVGFYFLKIKSIPSNL